MDVLLRGGRVLDPTPDRTGGALDDERDVLIEGGVITAVERGLAPPSGGHVIDLGGRLVVPGLVDIHVHFREPGQEYKEDIESGSKAAAGGGFTTVCCMPNTTPVNDCRSVTDLIVRRAREVDLCRVLPIGAVSQKLEGRSLAEFGEMQEAGCVAFSDDGRPVMDSGLMRRALEYARTFGLPVIQHAEDLSLAEEGVMNEGPVSTRLGLRGQPPAAESVMVARDIELVEWTGAPYHVAHVSTGRTIELVREAKRRGLPVTCEVTPHHFSLTDDACASYDTDFKVAPPLRGAADKAAIREGIADGTVDCIATDHAPHSSVEKDVEFDHAACGMTGLENSLAIGLELVRDGVVDLAGLIALMTYRPARAIGLAPGIGTLVVGGAADLAVVNLDKIWTIDRDATASKSHNNPFHAREVTGQVEMTFFGGRASLDRNGELA